MSDTHIQDIYLTDRVTANRKHSGWIQSKMKRGNVLFTVNVCILIKCDIMDTH